MTRTGGQRARPTTAGSGRRAPDAGARRPRAPRRPWTPALLLAAKIVGIPLFAVVVAFGLLYVRLLHGPVSLQFLIEPIQRAIADEMAGVGVGIEAVELRLAASGQIEFELRNVRVSDAAGGHLAFAPSATVGLSRRALLGGRIAPESVALVSPRLSLYYSEDGTLSLRFAAPGEAATARAAGKGQPQGERAAEPSGRGAPGGEEVGGLARIDLAKALAEVSARARRREHAGAYLREIGLKAATVVIDDGTRKSVWRVPELDVDLDHRRSRSSIAGRARIDSLAGPWTVNFRTFEHVATDTLHVTLSVQGLVPRALARAVPQLAALESLDVPVWGDARLELSKSGEILSGTIGVDAAPGRVLLPWLAATPLGIDGGHVELSYRRETRRFDIAPSVLVWGDSRIQFTGSVAHVAEGPQGPGWAFEVKSAGGWLGAEPPLLQRLPIESWVARGLYVPERGRVVLERFRLRAAGTEVSAEGDVSDMAGAMQARLDGKIGSMPASVFKTLWPAALAPRTRDWVVRRLVRGWVQGGSFRLASRADAAERGWSATGPNRGSLTLEGANLAFAVLDNWPLLEVPRALVRLDESSFEMTVPEAAIGGPEGRRLGLKGSFSVDMQEPLPRTGRVAMRAQGPLAAALELLDRDPYRLLQQHGLTLAGVDGKVDGQLAIAIPLGQPLEPRDLKIEGKVRVTEGRLGQALGPYQVHGATIGIDMSPTAVEARGDMLINGVVAKAAWQHVYGAPADKQPPLRITTMLDDSYRTQLGLDINDLVQGEVGVEVTVAADARGERRVHLRADLLNAEVLLESVAWRKPKGRGGIFEFDVVKGAAAYPLELHNVRLVGDNVAVEGWMGIGPDHRVREFRFPHFSLNVVTSLETSGKLRSDGIWEVTAKGPTYDGRDLFRSFFDVSRLGERTPKARPGLDLRAEVDTVVGFSDATLRNVRMTMQKRANKLTGLDVRGVLEGGKPFAAVVRHEAGESRRLLAEAMDAGLFFKLVGFYPNAVGGQMSLEVNLDGRGAAERTGTLWARDFVVLGDPVVSEVLQSADNPQGGSRKRVLREQFEFQLMKVPFEVGHGQFVMHDSALKGLLVSAHMRGKVDFRQGTLAIGGTYVPMSGLMSAPAEIPLLGPLLTGPRGEGLLGITFAIQGSMAKPEVIVNPITLLTPGIFREIFQMVPENPRVIPRERPAAPRTDGTRASSAPAAGPPGRATQAPGPAPEVGGSWSAETSESGTAPKRK